MKLVLIVVGAMSVGLGADASPAPAEGSGVAHGVESEHSVLVEPNPETVVEAFHRALAAGDSASGLDLLHPEILIFEQGAAEDLQEYRSHHLAADIRFASQTTRHVIDSQVEIRGEIAIFTARAHTTGRIGDRDIDSSGVETMVLTLTEEGWKILHIHWSSR